ncbi:monooxygenase FAD-binding [Methylobacterium nodulans ORS 2060]|uniref:Monooxygenase FAD-binding n=1 Tax=Methylobacterium nodulans (strain LMG 21967 / CNCM I-2342 / ORS 2060) TaxID=460265 RepID=B8IMP0_METNO|nr:monooxygenase FAD-binding [Methylobacterium nodulans ORS 2060]
MSARRPRCLHRAGWDVILLDTQAVHPHEFRAEKLGVPQMDLFDRLGAGASARAVATPVDAIDVVRFGRIVERERRREYGFTYTNLINRLRADLPEGLALTIGRVAEIRPDAERSRVTLTDGRVIAARLVVVSTGLGDLVRRKAGIGRTLISERHSLSIGFDLRAPCSAYPFEALTYYTEGFGERVAYLTLFPIGPVMRGNLFVYREPGEAWTRAFRADPETQLATLMPHLRRLCGDLSIAGPVEIRPMDLVRAENPARDGLVLVGDACLTTCPIPGTGIGRVLTDVDRLCAAYAPRWLAGPRITREDVAAFYADPVKVASDADSLRASLYARAIATEDGAAWRIRRLHNRVGRHLLHWLYGVRGSGRQGRPPHEEWFDKAAQDRASSAD